VGDGQDDQGDEEPQPVANSTNVAAVQWTRMEEQDHAGVPLRRVHAVEGARRLFSTPEGGLCGRPLRHCHFVTDEVI
jgi:hypothetical protein